MRDAATQEPVALEALSLTESENPTFECQFKPFIEGRFQTLLGVCLLFESQGGRDLRLTRPLLALIHSESAQLEELLDAYGARCNQRWSLVRRQVAATKFFSRAGYNLLHLKYSFKRYCLLPVDGDFLDDTRQRLCFIRDTLAKVLLQILECARAIHLRLPASPPENLFLSEDHPKGILPADRQTRDVLSAKDAVVLLATAFLELAAASDFLHLDKLTPSRRLADCIPDPVSEESLRQLEYRFHNMQAHYDTYLADTNTESLDKDLIVLRGHISIIFHLLETATIFVHYYERHLSANSGTAGTVAAPPVDAEGLLDITFNYTIAYASAYLASARNLCHLKLQHYAEITQVDLPVPRYRGFHVRPSTLIAKIVRHYASEVRMNLFGVSYDAAQPLALFRANERINAVKRRRIADLLGNLPPNRAVGPGNHANEVRRVVLQLAEQDRIVIYEHPLPLNHSAPYDGELFAQFVVDEITRLLAMGKIDIETDVTVTFVGDRRVLRDIRCLADNGYGEDRFGNDIPLPESLAYLKR